MADLKTRRRPAAVAVVVARGDSGDELLVVRRAVYPGDPWSGHIALPGGSAEPDDRTLEETARRETLEETGIDLGPVGAAVALAPVMPQSPGAPLVSITPFVFQYTGDKRIAVSPEIVEGWWVPVAQLENPGAWRTTTLATGSGFSIRTRAFELHGYTLWGLTERVIDEYLAMRASIARMSGGG
jgi:8-oxo-dGTP pyrophosphatase MutT (NUDIX family)